MPHVTHDLPMFDAFGEPTILQPKITYKLRVKNGYILALRPDQHQRKLPNLLHVHADHKH
ncbi:hypothetical protein ACFQ5J_05085 [Lacticaseibacillus baoqingensis]|uniref:Uncharacterized protein n=1 Tax=Lacticaseibacillus baoqingensis TaxID=2486013 RepID=A0ABW4E3Y1_9LACO|nr:hypothetical protein [Lacticaseibacillus baoqingensis]